ncbi:MAG: hypothetical protein M1823_000260 [Watsoniomyces obsoletus]|nr:MAG: hypothetical protein M1823_000260 [Watsoniomyces obsoletus]
MRLQSLLLLVLGASMGLASPVATPDKPGYPRKIWADEQSDGGDRPILQQGGTPGNAQEKPRQRSRQDSKKLNVAQSTKPQPGSRAVPGSVNNPSNAQMKCYGGTSLSHLFSAYILVPPETFD